MENLLLTKKEAADCLRISVATLDCIRKRGLVTPIKIGARVYYTPAFWKRRKSQHSFGMTKSYRTDCNERKIPSW